MLLLDDLGWTYAGHGDEISLSPPSDKMFPMSADELHTSHVGAIVDVILKAHPAFGEIRIEDDRWAWCRKDSSATTRLTARQAAHSRYSYPSRLSAASAALEPCLRVRLPSLAAVNSLERKISWGGSHQLDRTASTYKDSVRRASLSGHGTMRLSPN